jgi:nucleotide-binding universal stress UspA family protein
MLDHVLVPLDGSQLAEQALEHARQIVNRQGRITLLTAVDVPEIPMYGLYPPASIPDYQAAIEDALPQARAYLEQIGQELVAAGYSVSSEAQIGDAAEVIARTAQELGVDAIVMSTHGRSGLSRWLFGSVTSKVLSAKVCPVFVIPSRREQEEDEPAIEVAGTEG